MKLHSHRCSLVGSNGPLAWVKLQDPNAKKWRRGVTAITNELEWRGGPYARRSTAITLETDWPRLCSPQSTSHDRANRECPRGGQTSFLRPQSPARGSGPSG